MELVQHEDVHSRQASVLTFKCSLSKDGQWIRSRSDCDPQMYSPRRVYLLEFHMDNRVEHEGSWGSPEMVLDFYSWVYVTDLFRDLQYHPTSMGWGSRSLCWLIPFSWSLHRIGCPDIRTPICCGRATALFPSMDDIDMLVNQWLPFTCSHSYHVYEAYSSRCGLAWNVHPLLCSSIPFQDASWNSTPF